MGDLLDGYRIDSVFDEMLEARDRPRTHYRTLFEQIQTLSRADFEERCGMRDRVFSDRGVTFAFSGEEERPFPLDLVPRIISAAEWSIIERGVGQRVLALERFLADVYGPAEIMRDRVVPRRLVVNSSQGGGSKDTWVPSGIIDDAPPERWAGDAAATPLLTRQPPDPGPPVGQQAAQQQQQQQ